MPSSDAYFPVILRRRKRFVVPAAGATEAATLPKEPGPGKPRVSRGRAGDGAGGAGPALISPGVAGRGSRACDPARPRLRVL